LLRRIPATTDREVADVHMEFKSGVGTRDQIFNLRILFQKARVASSSLYVAFINYKKAVDSMKLLLCGILRRIWN